MIGSDFEKLSPLLDLSFFLGNIAALVFFRLAQSILQRLIAIRLYLVYDTGTAAYVPTPWYHELHLLRYSMILVAGCCCVFVAM